ncbi:hypothetical protein J2Y67_002556 [Neobacillus niacini]|nr:hypothetical protein [Neobacillus niacini]
MPESVFFLLFTKEEIEHESGTANGFVDEFNLLFIRIDSELVGFIHQHLFHLIPQERLF